MTPIAFAHRGARLEAPENTIAAFTRALEHGATGLETDAWLSSDGQVVLAHDAAVRRGLRRRAIGATTASQLSAFDVPTLGELYGTLGHDFELSIDVKDPQALDQLVAEVTAHGAPQRAWLCSPDLDIVARVVATGSVRAVHSRPRARLDVPLERHAANLAEIGADAMNMPHTDWTAGLVSLFHRFDVAAFAWDAQEVRQLEAMLAIGVDALYCDRPDRLMATINAWSA